MSQETVRAVKPADAPEARRTCFLQPGQLVASMSPHVVTTVLGSCVAVCLWDPKRRLGGAAHYVLPTWPGGTQASPRFGDTAIEQLLEKLCAFGSNKADMQAKVFGGACMIGTPEGEAGQIGQLNIDIAVARLAAHNIRIVSRDVGGRRGRKLLFNTDDGAASIKAL